MKLKIADRDLDLFRKTYQEATERVHRFTLLRTLVIGLVVLAYIHAFHSINQGAIDRSARSLEQLSPLTGKDALALEASPFQGFFVIRNLLVDFDSSGNSRHQTVSDMSSSNWVSACRELARGSEETKKANSQLNDAQSRESVNAVLDGSPACQSSKQKIPSAIFQVAEIAQEQYAKQLKDEYAHAFTSEVSFLGIKTFIDLRNWFAFIPVLLLVSEIYFFIERKKLNLLSIVIASDVQSTPEREAGAYDRLFISRSGPFTGAFSRHPSQLLGFLQYGTVMGLLAYLGYEVFWGPLDFSNVIYPAITTTIIAGWHSLRYCRHVASELEKNLSMALNLAPSTRPTVGSCRPIGPKVFGMAKAFFGPRLQLSSGSCLVLATLFMSINVSFCSDNANPKGYQFLKGLGQLQGENSPSVNWFTSEISLDRYNDTGLMTGVLLTTIKANQRLTWFVYLSSLLLSILTALLLLYAKVKKSPPLPIIFWCSLAGMMCSIYFAADLALYFLSPKLKLTLVILYLILPALSFYRSARNKKLSESFAAGIPVALAAYVFALLTAWPDNSSWLRMITENLGLTFMFLLLGTQFLTFGFLRILRQSAAAPSRTESVGIPAASSV
ncbi:MAG TPA: hypothetical protein VE422_21630 [Terriglobia bacterium]|nr:hypothetical protein [Terriglobia bacterium]